MKLSITIKSYAKINFFLRVLGKRDDGYHNIKTGFQKIDLSDELTFRILKSDCNCIKITSSKNSIPTDQNNLIYKAAELFLEKNSIKLQIEIDLIKNIPVGAGLGGGSSNGAATLLALNNIMGNPLSKNELYDLGLRLGSDVPFFISEYSAAIGMGRGEILSEIPSLDGYLILVYPGFAISTKWVYENLNLTKKNKDNILFDFSDDFGINDLEESVLREYPVISEIKERLSYLGADRAFMTGSGSTVVGYFKDRDKALISYKELNALLIGDSRAQYETYLVRCI